MTIRTQVIHAFQPDKMIAYSHVLPFRFSNFIDGMAWVSVLAGACIKVKDIELLHLCEAYLNTLISCGENARNYAPEMVSDDWKRSKYISALWYKEKPQSFAGPAALYWAIDLGARIDPQWVKPVYNQAKLYCWLASWYGRLVNHLGFLKQHINSIMLAHLLLHKKPPASLIFAARENPFYSYLYGIPCKAQYSSNQGAWPAKNVWGAKDKNKTYTPTCQLASDYLQSTIGS